MQVFIPYIYAFIAMFAYASLGVLAKKVGDAVTPFMFIAISTFFVAAFSIVIAFFHPKEMSLTEISMPSWTILFIFSVVNLVAYAFFLWAIKGITVAEYQLIYLLSPVVGGLLAYAIVQEPFKLQYLVGLAFMGVGLYIALKK